MIEQSASHTTIAVLQFSGETERFESQQNVERLNVHRLFSVVGDKLFEEACRKATTARIERRGTTSLSMRQDSCGQHGGAVALANIKLSPWRRRLAHLIRELRLRAP